MCQRKENEPALAYAFRWAVESFTAHPVSVVCVFCLCATAWMYRDMSELLHSQGELMKEQTAAYQKIVAEMREINVRLQNIEIK